MAEKPQEKERSRPGPENATWSLLPDYKGPEASAGETGPATLTFDAHRSAPSFRIGKFEARRLLGEGAFGAVYEAYDPQLDRVVALKIAKLDRGDATQRVKRFLREAKAAAGLRHPHIVPVHEFGQEGDRFYIATGFVPGGTLETALASRKAGTGSADFTWAVAVIRDLAEALAYAHGQGIVHRDVKPANVLLDDQGEPLLTDFGLASRREEAEKLTHAGAVLGTPLYMAPEQARGEEEVLPASDQYSLGVMLFEMLTGETPFHGPPELVMFHHLETEPPRPRSKNPGIPRDLETICLKCLEKDPAKRFTNCNGLADDLRRWQEGEPIRARRVGLLERTGKWCRRNRLLAGLLAAVVVLLVGGSTAATLLAVWATAEANQAEIEKQNAVREKELADKARGKAEGLVYASYTTLALADWERGDPIQAGRWLDLCRWDKRAWEHHYLNRLFEKKTDRTLSLGRFRGPAIISPDGSHCVAVGVDGFGAWNLRSGLKEPVESVFWLPKIPKRVVLDNRIATKYVDQFSRIRCFAFSPDGGILAWANEKSVRVLDFRSSSDPLVLPVDQIDAISISPDLQWIACASSTKVRSDGETTVWNVRDGTLAFTLPGTKDHPNSAGVSFSPDGAFLATICGTHVKLWNVSRKTEVRRFEHNDISRHLAFSPDGELLVCSFGRVREPGAVKVWDVRSGQVVQTLRGHSGIITKLTFSPDSARLVTGSADRMVKVWDPRGGTETLTLRGADGLASLRFQNDGRILIGLFKDGTVRFWDAGSRRRTPILHHGGRPVQSVAFGPKGDVLATLAEGAIIKIWDSRTGLEIKATEGKPSSYTGKVLFDSSGNRLAVDEGFDVMIFDPALKKEPRKIQAEKGPINGMTFSPDGTFLVTASGWLGQTGVIQVWDTASGSNLRTFSGQRNLINAIAIHPDGRLLATVGLEKSVSILDLKEGRCLKVLGSHTDIIQDVTFSKDGTELVSVGLDGMRFWDVAGATASGSVAIQGLTTVRYGPKGKLLAIGSVDGTVRIFDAGGRKQLLSISGHGDRITSLSFAPTGKVLASSSRDGTVRLWDLDQEFAEVADNSEK